MIIDTLVYGAIRQLHTSVVRPHVIIPKMVSLDRFHCIVSSTMFDLLQILVTSIEVNKDTLDCGVQPLDLITHLDGKTAESLCDIFGRCTPLSSKMMKCTADVWVARTPGIPSMSLIQSER